MAAIRDLGQELWAGAGARPSGGGSVEGMTKVGFIAKIKSCFFCHPYQL